MENNYKKWAQKKLADLNVKRVAILGAVVWVMSLSGCQASKKTIYSSHSKIDSSNVSNTHNAAGSTVDSSRYQQTETTNTTGIKVVFDSADNIPWIGGDAEDIANDLTATPVKKPVHTISINGQVISSNRKIASVNITQHGITSTIDATQLQKKDSSTATTSNDVKLVKDIQTTTKEVKRPGMMPWIWLLLGLAVAGLVVRKYFFNKV